MKDTRLNNIEVWYLNAWGGLHVLTGLIFSVIFILGAVVLKDYTYLIYLFLSFGLVFFGIVRLRKPYLICSDFKITVIGLFGKATRQYIWTDKKELQIKGNRFYLNNQKLKFNNWFTNQNQYQNMIRFYSGSDLLGDELQG